MPGLLVVMAMMACDPSRAVAVERCGNGIDDDFDGRVDCRDPQCSNSYACQDEAEFLEPELPRWFLSDLGSGSAASTPAHCDQNASEDSQIYRWGCSLLPDDCGSGLRCVPLSRGALAYEGVCVREGCARESERCESHESGSPSDVCGAETLCMDLPQWCQGGSCCRSLCQIADPHCAQCVSLTRMYGEEWESLLGLGVCGD